MKSIINGAIDQVVSTVTSNIKLIFTVTSVKKSVLNCNYSNNYYGDQYCQQKSK
ncbi:hypothetical protein MTCD1_01722 [Colwellia marinimaniae]|uniref:Uncharacterized protein n=1 Tax=Colwellia marinimaniae TaxID=1513592 RepID=A0ABQ0MV54_9GAMM|nr:hypothetical protein MTCD1_01722 [Colwellia marinimaniae]